MSDDVITSFLQSQPAVESKPSLDKPAENESQVTDFKEVISQEEKKLSVAHGQTKEDKQAEGKTPRVGISVEGDSAEAIDSQKAGQKIDISGNSLPNLSLHDRALAVGRVIYTSENVAVTNESLSKFMKRQGLVNEKLLGAVDPGQSHTAIAEDADTNPVLPNQYAVPQGDAEIKPSPAEKELLGVAGHNVITQLAVKQVISGRGISGEVKSEGSSAKNLTATAAAGEAIAKSNQVLHSTGNGEDPQAGLGSGLQGQQTGSDNGEMVGSVNRPVGKKEALSIAQQFGQAAKLALELDQKVQDDVKSASANSEKLTAENGLKVKDGQEDALPKNHVLMTKEDAETKKTQNIAPSDLQRFLLTANKAAEGRPEKPIPGILNQLDGSEAIARGNRDVAQYTAQEATHAESNQQNRVEFKGALREAQRLVASSAYNNLTDSYESWSSRFGEVLAHRIAGYISKENWSVQLRMNPASLGEISLEIDFSEKGLEGRFGSNEESTRQLLHDTLPKLRLALREILEDNQGLKFDVSDFGNSNQDDETEKNTSPELVEEINFESEVLLGRTLDSKLSSVVGLDILV